MKILQVVTQSRFRRQRIQAHVPGFGEACFGALTIECESDQMRSRQLRRPLRNSNARS